MSDASRLSIDALGETVMASSRIGPGRTATGLGRLALYARERQGDELADRGLAEPDGNPSGVPEGRGRLRHPDAAAVDRMVADIRRAIAACAERGQVRMEIAETRQFGSVAPTAVLARAGR